MLAARRKRRNSGAVLVDALIASFLLVLGSLAYFSLIPVVMRGQEISKNQTKAIHIANRVIEHLLLLKPSTLTATNLTQLALIDPGQTAPPYSISNLPLDDGWNYSPAKTLPGGAGVMRITDLSGNTKLVQIEISWDGPKGRITYTTGTALGGYR
jgi:hypothetical protein